MKKINEQNAYNKAVKYLEEKFGQVPSNYEDEKFSHNERRLIALVKQYYLGQNPKMELDNLVMELGL